VTGPEHYEEAQSCVEMGNHVHGAALYFAEAQVHATLALAAATAFRATEANAESPRGGDTAWRDAGMW
jgi:hypothetical protein